MCIDEFVIVTVYMQRYLNIQRCFILYQCRINRGVAYFCFEKGEWQVFQLQLFQSSIKCYITLQGVESPKDLLPMLLQQRREMLIDLELRILKISKTCMPSAKAPVTCLECPFKHEDCCPPHVELNIHQEEVLMCYEKLPKATKLPQGPYSLLFAATQKGMCLSCTLHYVSPYIFIITW